MTIFYSARSPTAFLPVSAGEVPACCSTPQISCWGCWVPSGYLRSLNSTGSCWTPRVIRDQSSTSTIFPKGEEETRWRRDCCTTNTMHVRAASRFVKLDARGYARVRALGIVVGRGFPAVSWPQQPGTLWLRAAGSPLFAPSAK